MCLSYHINNLSKSKEFRVLNILVTYDKFRRACLDKVFGCEIITRRCDFLKWYLIKNLKKILLVLSSVSNASEKRNRRDNDLKK